MIHRIPHASHWGAYTLLVENDRILGVEPSAIDPAPSAIIHSVVEWAKPDRRVLRPLVREGWLAKRDKSDRSGRGREKFIAIPWDEATDLVAEEITRVAARYGNESIFAGSYGWTSCGRFHHASTLLKRMLNLVGGYTGHVDTYSIAAGPVILRHTLGDDQACAGRANTLDTIVDHTETLLVFGALSPRTAQTEAGGIGAHRLEDYLRQIRAKGIKVILISPMQDDIPDWVGAEWWPIRPNTDTALMLGIAGEIVARGGHDREFLERCTSGSGRLLDYLTGAQDGTPKTADWAASITGIPANLIRDLALRMRTTRSMIMVSWALQRAHHGEQPFWAGIALAAVTGQIGLPGGGVGFGYGSLGGMGAPFHIGKNPGMSQGPKPIDSFIPVARISDMLLQPGAGYTYQGENRTYPNARLVYWAGGNPFHHHQDLNRLAEAWTRPETIIVQDPMMTATALRADIVLPASSSLERNDIAGNKRADVFLAMKQAISPLGEARSDFDIFRGLSHRLGVGAAFDEGLDEMGWIRRLYDESRGYAANRLNFEMPEFETFWEQGHATCPVQKYHTYLAEFRADPARHPLDTESGLIVLGSETLARLNYSDCLPHPAWIEPAEWLGKAADNELHMISHQPEGRLHSQLDTGGASLAGRSKGRERLRLNPADATVLGISDDQVVRAWTDRGECLATAQLDTRVAPGVAVLPTGAWFTPSPEDGMEQSGNPNVLTLDVGTSAFGQGCSAHTCLIRVEPWRGQSSDPKALYDARIGVMVPLPNGGHSARHGNADQKAVR